MLLLLHLTDLHLYADAQACLKTINTRASLEAVLAAAKPALTDADALILGGDLAQDESPAAYKALKGMLTDFKAPVLITPGNHDDPAALNRIFAPLGHLDLGAWRIIALNTHEDGQDGGRLAKAELARLQRLLADADNRYVLVCMHHQPVAIGSAWMDEIGLANAEAFWALVERYHCVRGVLFGHVHQQFEARRGNILLFGSPSTCIQFKPNEAQFWLDGKPPGFRWLKLDEHGGIDSGVVRISGFIPSDLSDNAPY